MAGMELAMDLVADDLHLRTLVRSDAALVVEATRQESGPALWGPRPAGPYTLDQAGTALAAWSPDRGRVSHGMLREGRLLGALAVMRDGPGTAELAYWIRPEQRGQGLASRGLRLVTGWAHRAGLVRLWLEIDPVNRASLRVADRGGYRFEQRLPRHCRSWVSEDEAGDEWHDCLIWSHTLPG